MTEAIASPPAAEVPFNQDFQRNYMTKGIGGEEIEVFESEFVLDSNNRVARFRVMGNRTELESEIASFERRLATYLSAVRHRHDRHQRGRHPARPAAAAARAPGAGAGARGHGTGGSTAASRPRSSRSPTRPTR